MVEFSASKLWRFSLRSAIPALGLLAATWSVSVLPSLWSGATFDTFAEEIRTGEPFRAEALQALGPEMRALTADGAARPYSLRGAALIQLRLAEISISQGTVSHNEQFHRAEAAVEKALEAMPSDSFLWFALFWLKKNRDGYSSDILPLLRRSYAMGPHEGWIAVHRNELAVPLLPLLPQEMRTRVITEFRDLATHGYPAVAASILAGAGLGHRDALLASLSDTPLDARRLLAEAIDDRDEEDAAEVPGVTRVRNRARSSETLETGKSPEPP